MQASRPGITVTVAVVLAVALSVPVVAASGQEEDAREVRVAQERANVHQGASTGRVVLVQVPEGTVLPIVGRQGEWIEVELSPELREAEAVTVIRWYEDEESGFMHQSWVEIVDVSQVNPFVTWDTSGRLSAGRSQRQAMGRPLLHCLPAHQQG